MGLICSNAFNVVAVLTTTMLWKNTFLVTNNKRLILLPSTSGTPGKSWYGLAEGLDQHISVLYLDLAVRYLLKEFLKNPLKNKAENGFLVLRCISFLDIILIFHHH